MAISTITDPTSMDKAYTDDLVSLRQWAATTPLVEFTSPARRTEYVIGSDSKCHIRIVDPDLLVSKQHARLVLGHDGWKIQDLESKNGLYVDRQRCTWAPVRGGTEIGLGQRFIIIADTTRTLALRSFLRRLLGWDVERSATVDLALRNVLAAKPGRAFAIVSKSDPVAIAYSIHRIAFGAGRPFVTCDPKRQITDETVRYTENYSLGVEALRHAAGGTLCVMAARLPSLPT